MKLLTTKLPITLVVACTFTLIGTLVFLGLKSPDVRRADEQTSGKLSYVLVNQDAGAEFNGNEYNLGQDFLNLVNQDTDNRWQTASQSVAEAGFQQGAYDAHIIIPNNFSAKILALESLTPEKAEIVYRTKQGQNEISNQLIQQKIGNILNGFNRRVIKMYFTSILGNLAEAQRNVNSIVDGEQKLQETMTDGIQDPFKNLPNSFGSVVGDAGMLEQQN